MAGRIEPDMFSAAVSFWTSITASRRQKSVARTTQYAFGPRGEAVDIMTALATAGLVIMIRFTPPA
ncbi:hypothetical protein NKH64_27750 [Mesorhizobium sp. M0999]|uniref:hypothetical protein n=1 Tax=Mesorhizobium sp. M0999 TaxID=2957045 RepID=UPI00333B2CD5